MLIALLMAASTTSAASAVESNMSTITSGSDMNFGTALAYKLNQPWGLLFDKQGNLIIVDSGNQRIEKMTQTKLTTLAGIVGKPDAYGRLQGGYLDGDAAKAVFNDPRFAVVDSKGNVYITDFNNHSIRKIKNGKVYTLAGTGKAGFKNGKGSEAQFNSPTGIAIDSKDNLYVSDTLNHVIRKITPEGAVTTLAGEQSATGGFLDGVLNKARFNEPSGLVFDDKGNLFVADSGNHLIRVVSTVNNQVLTYAGKKTDIDSETGYMAGGYSHGNKETARFNSPKGLAYADGVLFVADSLNNRIRAIQPDGKVINLAGLSKAGDTVGPADVIQLNMPVAVAYAKGQLYIADSLNNKIKTLPVDPKQLKPVQTKEDLIAGFEFAPASEIVQVWLDGKLSTFVSSNKPFQKDALTYLPIRDIIELWGGKVEWIPASNEAKVTMGAWNASLVEDGEHVLLKDERMYIDLDRLQELSSFAIVYDEDYNALVINRKQ